VSTTGHQPEPKRVSQDKQSETSITRFVDLWWIQIPGKLRSYSHTLWAVWSDGIYLTAWPRVAITLVFLVFLFGLVEGGTHWSFVGLNGYGLVGHFHAVSFAEMFPLLVVAVLLGSLSTNLGLMLVIGFALGDFFWSGVPYWPWGRDLLLPRASYFRISQIAAYLVFFFLAAWPMIGTKFLVAAAHRRFRESEVWKTVLMVIVQALFIYEWTYFAPMGVKWQWGCCNLDSQLDVRYFHATTAPWLVAAAVIGVVARRLLILAADKKHPEVTSRLYEVCDPAWALNPRIPRWLNAIIRAAIMSLLLLGFAGSLAWAAATFAILAGILLVRLYVLPFLSLWKAWRTRAAAYPAVVRLTVATIATYFICRLILTVPRFAASQGHTMGDFGPELGAILAGFVVLLVLLPNGMLTPEEEELGAKATHSRLPIPSGVVQAAIIICLVLLNTKKAFAAECRDPACCFGGDNGLAAAAAAGGIPGLGGVAAGAAAAAGMKGALNSNYGKGYRQGWRHGFRNGQNGRPAVTGVGPALSPYGPNPMGGDFGKGFMNGIQDGHQAAVPPATSVDPVTRYTRFMQKAGDYLGAEKSGSVAVAAKG
jgi:hypothetical protein